MNNKIDCIGAFHNVYEECGSIIALKHGGRAHNYFYLFIFFLRKELILPSFLDVLSVVSCSLHEWSASQTMNQLTENQNQNQLCRKLENQLK